MQPNSAQNDFQCSVKSCSFASQSKREFNAHKLAHDGINAKRWLPYTCSQCPARFHSSDDQLRHAEAQGSRQYVCPRCPQSFYFKPGLEMHYEAAHADEPNPDIPIPFQCPHCKIVCKTPFGLEMHLRWRYMGACLAGIGTPTMHTSLGAGSAGAPNQQPSPPPGEEIQPQIMQLAATIPQNGHTSEVSGNSTPIYAPIPTVTSRPVSAPSSVATTDASTQASSRQATPEFGLMNAGAKTSLNQLAAAVAANYQEMLSPTNSTDKVMGTYTPDDVQSKQMATSNSMIPFGYSSTNVSFRNGVVTPLSNNSPSATPLSTVSSAYRESSSSTFSSPKPEELSPSSRLSVRVGERPNSFDCSDCMESFSSRELFNYHLRTAHFVPLSSERKFECKTCFKVCTTQSGLDYHNRTHLKSIEERRAYKCQECSQVFTVRSTLYRHQRTQHAATLDERKPYRCMYCGKAFASRYNLNRHADTRHPGLSREPLK